jgi:hypothetical protein
LTPNLKVSYFIPATNRYIAVVMSHHILICPNNNHRIINIHPLNNHFFINEPPHTPPYGASHKVRTYKEYHSVCPSSELGFSQPLSRQRVFPSPQKQGGGGTLACGWGVGGSPNFDEGHTLWYSLYVRTLWSQPTSLPIVSHLPPNLAITFPR